MLALALAAAVVSVPTTAPAAKGDCAQPASEGPAPVASDCLFILKAAVGSLTCTPACICSPTGDDSITASDALACLRKSVGAAVTLNCPCTPPQTNGDDFNDNSRDPAKWDNDDVYGNGMLQETGQRLEYTCNSPTDEDEVLRPWILSDLPYDASWEVQLDVVNLTSLSADEQVNSFGIDVTNPQMANTDIYAEIYASQLGGPPTRTGFYAGLDTLGEWVADADSFDLGVTRGAVRMTFDPASKVISVFYDVEPTDGYAWVQYGSFGIAGSGGLSGNSDWQMSQGDSFAVYVYGYSSLMTIASGQLYGDNFQVTGGIAR